MNPAKSSAPPSATAKPTAPVKRTAPVARATSQLSSEPSSSSESPADSPAPMNEKSRFERSVYALRPTVIAAVSTNACSTTAPAPLAWKVAQVTATL
jgi:hypothetical protein